MKCTRPYCGGTYILSPTQDGPAIQCHLCNRAPDTAVIPAVAASRPAPLARCACGFHPRSEASMVQHQVHAHGGKPTVRYRQGPQVVLGKTDRGLWVERP